MMARTRSSSAVSRRRLFRATAGGALAAAVAALAARGRPARAAGTATAGVSALALAMPSQSGQTPPGAPVQITDAVLQAFDADVQTAMQTFNMVGAAVALFQSGQIVYNRGFGVRDVQSNAPVTPSTRFRIASNTKSMTSMLMAMFVDEGRLGWDTRAVDLWPEFRAPSDALTQTLRIRDLLGMGSGVAESPTIEFFMMGGGESALDVLRSIAYLPVIAPPNTTYYYNNTLVAAAPFLELAARGTPLASLEEAYAAETQRRIFAPIGMIDAAIASDPRPLGPDYATGYTRDLFDRVSREPFVSIDGVGPAGSGIASSTDMARYLITQMNGGVTPDGRRIVSAANLTETHTPGAGMPPSALSQLPEALLPDTTAMYYCMGWFDQTFKDGRHLLWHAGGIDGFGSLMGFFPQDQLGFVFLTNVEPTYAGIFNFSIQGSLLSRLFGLNNDLPALLASGVPILAQQRAALAERNRPVDPTAITPYLGLYSQGFQVRLNPPDDLRLEHDIRSLPLLALADGGYVVAAGPGVVQGKTVTFATAADGSRTMAIDGFEPANWLTGD